MEALVPRVALVLLACCSLGANYRTENFVVSARTAELAREVAMAAEQYRAELAVSWLGEELPRWAEPCPISVTVGPRTPAAGQTTFFFENAPHASARAPQGDGLFQAMPVTQPFGWEMSVQGSRERVLDSVLPHEVTHTIFASHFGRPLPRWADEGACTTVEHETERDKQHQLLYEFLTTGRGIAFNRMFAMKEYPRDMLPLYSQGYSLARFLIAQGGRQKFVQYVGDGLDSNNWTAATETHYGFASLSDLQVTWLDWVRGGCIDMPSRSNSEQSNELLLANDRADDQGPIRDQQSSFDAQYLAEPARAETYLAGQSVPNRSGLRQTPTTTGSELTAPSSGVSWYASQKNRALGSELASSEPVSPVADGSHPDSARRDPVRSPSPRSAAISRVGWTNVNPSATAQLPDRKLMFGRNLTAPRQPEQQLLPDATAAAATVTANGPSTSDSASSNSFYANTLADLPNESPRRLVPVAIPGPSSLRTLSRPEPTSAEREVIIEWGQPSPFLSPALARKSTASDER